jgi:hypothetical protein
MLHAVPLCAPAQLTGDLLECRALITMQHARQPHSPKRWVGLLCVVLCHAAAQYTLKHLQDRAQQQGSKLSFIAPLHELLCTCALW